MNQPNSPKERLDVLLVERGLAENRSRAQALIMAGLVHSDNARLDKPGNRYASDIPLMVSGQEHPWVSRGGQKLDGALTHFSINPEGMIAIDVGASTGGFTDVLLQKGAACVYAIDVGHGQLDWKLRQDERVIVFEKTNARHLTSEQVPVAVDMVVCDASFISLKTVLPSALALTKDEALLVALIKPQFEAGKEHVGKGGVVRDEAIHQRVCDEIESWINSLPHWQVQGIKVSPILGPKGNKEFLIFAKKLI